MNPKLFNRLIIGRLKSDVSILSDVNQKVLLLVSIKGTLYKDNPSLAGLLVENSDTVVFNIGKSAIVNLEFGDELLTFGAKFNGIHHDICLRYEDIFGVTYPDLNMYLITDVLPAMMEVANGMDLVMIASNPELSNSELIPSEVKLKAKPSHLKLVK